MQSIQLTQNADDSQVPGNEATTQESVPTNSGSQEPNDVNPIFDADLNALMDQFGKGCEEKNVDVALAILVHPEKGRVVFCRGHIYDVTTAGIQVVSQMREDLLRKLQALP